MTGKYYLLFKTGDAELRALEKTHLDFSKMSPIIELTRGRKSKYDKVGSISKRLEKLNNIFKNQSICLDITSSDLLSNSEIEDLYNPKNGYKNWVNFVTDIDLQGNFKEVIPTIIVETNDVELDRNLLNQVIALSSNFKKLAYRNNILDEGCYDDIKIISNTINADNNTFYFILDCEYVPTGAYPNTVELLKKRVKKIRGIIPKTKFIVVSTSFPRYVSDIGNDDYDIFPLNEIDIYDGVFKENPDVLYGDYASVNPIRNDTVIMSRGWIPRIDVPTLKGIYYYRLRNTINDYATTYSRVARKVHNDGNFPHYLSGNWGIKQIEICKDGDAPGSSPNFWISVRMSIFIAMQLKRWS